MNRALVYGEHIEDGDFILVEKINGYVPREGDVIVSNIGGLANVKKFHKEPSRIVLLPESYRDDYYPIFIDANDDFSVEGRVVGVVKAVRQTV